MSGEQQEGPWKDLPKDVLYYMASNFFDHASRKAVKQTCHNWRESLIKHTEDYKHRLKVEKNIDLDWIPAELLEAHPIDPVELYNKLRYLPPNQEEIFSGRALRNFPIYVLIYALIGHEGFEAAAERAGLPEGRDYGQKYDYSMARIAAIGGDLVLFKKFIENTFDRDELRCFIEEAAKADSVEIVEHILSLESFEVSYALLQDLHFRSVEYCAHNVRSMLEAKHNVCAETNNTKTSKDYFYAAVNSGNIPLFQEFCVFDFVEKDFLHKVAEKGHVHLFDYAMQKLQLRTDVRDEKGLLPVHYSCASVRMMEHALKSHPLDFANKDDPDVVRLIFCAAKESHRSDALICLHQEYGADVSVIEPETGNSVAHYLRGMGINRKRLAYFVLYTNINWQHVNNKGCLFDTPPDDSTLFFNYSAIYKHYYFQNIEVFECMFKALSNDDDANLGVQKLQEFCAQNPRDAMSCLALALINEGDNAEFKRCKHMAIRRVGLAQYPKVCKQFVDVLTFLKEDDRPGVHSLALSSGCNSCAVM